MHRRHVAFATDSEPETSDELSSSRRPRRGLDLLVGSAVILVLQLPVLSTNHAYFGDWGNHLFLLDQQTRWLRSHLLPTYFVHTTHTGAFYPHFLFYGGTLYSIVGRVGTVFGTVVAYKLSFLLAAAACYFGTVWAARLLGVRSLAAHLPAIIASSSAYYLSVEYLSGGWAEFVALSMVPLVAASALSLLVGRRARVGAGLALAVGVIILTGSHNITTEYGLSFLALVGAVGVLAVAPVQVEWRRVALVVVTVLLAVGVNAWFVVPATRYSHLTSVFLQNDFDFLDRVTSPLNSWRLIFNPWRVTGELVGRKSDPFYLQEPVLVLVWTAVAAIVAVKAGPTRVRRACLGLASALALYLLLLLWRAPLEHAPDAVRLIQFRFRLHAYVGFATVALVIVCLLGLTRSARRRVWIGSLVVATAAAFGASVWQTWSAPTFLPIATIEREQISLPPIDYSGCPAPCSTVDIDYRMRGDTVASNSTAIPADIADARTGVLRFSVPPGRTSEVNIVWSPIVATSAEAPIVGASPAGLVVVRAGPSPDGQVLATARFSPTRATTVGIAITAVCVAALSALLVVGSTRTWARMRASVSSNER